MAGFDPDEVQRCLDEIDRVLFKVGDSDECRRCHNETQLTATLLLLFRMPSLVRPLLLLLKSENFDGFDATLRAFEETWYLAMEFRLAARRERAMAWLAGAKDSWKAKFGVLIDFAKKRGHPSPIMGVTTGCLVNWLIPQNQRPKTR
jgi:hypothetical protein